MLPSHHKKTNMVFDGMRVGGGRCPPLIVTVLLVTCFILVCNWWNLSTANVAMLTQVEELQEQLKISVSERDSCLVQKINSEERYRNSEKEVATLHVRLQKLNELQKQTKALEDSLDICHSELDSLAKLDATKTATLEARRLETDRLDSQLESKKADALRLQGELDQVKNELDQLKQTCKGSGTQKEKTESVAADLDHKENDDDKAEEALSNVYEDTTPVDFIDDLRNPKEAAARL